MQENGLAIEKKKKEKKKNRQQLETGFFKKYWLESHLLKSKTNKSLLQSQHNKAFWAFLSAALEQDVHNSEALAKEVADR